MPENSTQNPQVVARVHKPFKAGLPNLVEYFAELWRRRELAYELAKAQLRAQQSTTLFGQLWLVINPLIMAGIYYTLVIILSSSHAHGPDFVAHMLAGMFAYHMVTGAMGLGAASVVSLGKLIANRSFPRLLLPFSAALVALRRFVPSMIIYVIYHVAFKQPIGLAQLYAIPAFILLAIFIFGLSALLATLQVYFRDMRSFLPFISRIGMYVSPILWYPEALPAKIAIVEKINPLFSLLSVWTESLVKLQVPSANLWLTASCWSIGTFVLGTLIFLSREREFSVRI